jgi:hypothetical protein
MTAVLNSTSGRWTIACLGLVEEVDSLNLRVNERSDEPSPSRPVRRLLLSRTNASIVPLRTSVMRRCRYAGGR